MGFGDIARATSIATRQSRAAAHAAATLALIREAQAAGAKNNRAIAEYLNAQGSRTPWGCPWNVQRIGLMRRQWKGVQCP